MDTAVKSGEDDYQKKKGAEMKHVIKILEPYADAIEEGRKTFEVRYNDRGYNAGDEVTFLVVEDDKTCVGYHPLERKRFEITYVHSGLGMEYGYVVFGLKEKPRKGENYGGSNDD